MSSGTLVAIAVLALTVETVLSSEIESNVAVSAESVIRNLVAEPDYRAVRLKWNCHSVEGLVGFDMRFCEITNWQSKNRCKEQTVKLTEPSKHLNADSDEPVVDLQDTGPNKFEASITNLRMLTNYSITVKPQFGNVLVQLDNAKHYPQLFVETKSFAAKTSRCLANSSDIEVQTGPYFRGKISVEGSSNPSCATFGNRSSQQGVYTFTINHDLCGSKRTNNSRIETMVIVHENKEILTHNSRRYMVVCTFAPEIYSLTASVAVPNHLLKKVFDRIREKQFQLSLSTRNEALNQINNEHLNQNRTPTEKVSKMKRFSVRREHLRPSMSKQSHLRDSRMLAEDSRAKWLRQRDGADNEQRATPKGGKLLASNQLALSLVMGICVVILVGVVVSQYRLHGKIACSPKRVETEQRQKETQMVPTVDKVTSHQSTGIPS